MTSLTLLQIKIMFGTVSETKKNLLAEVNLPVAFESIFLDRLNALDHRYIKDLKINVSNALKAQTLKEKEAVLLALSVAINEKSTTLISALEELAKSKGAKALLVISKQSVEEFDKDGEIEDRIMYSDTIFPSSKIYEMSFKLVPNCLRVSTMIYPNSFLNANGGIVWMRSLGIDVDVFSLTKFSADE